MKQKSHGSTRNYKFGQKNNWRRSLWNDVLRRTAGREKTEAILYFAGPQDLDRAVAVSKGVPDRNLIAIDRSIENVHKVRSGSHYAIHADVVDVLRSWPSSVPVCALVLDFCCGLMSGDYLGALYQLTLFHRPLANSVLALNIQRGRDAAAKALNDESQRALNFLQGNSHQIANTLDPKHRGFAFVFGYAMFACVDQVALMSSAREVGEKLDRMKPRFFTYRSGVLTFDSVVASPAALRFNDEDTVQIHSLLRERYPKEQGVVRKIAATLATRTRQQYA